MDCHQRKRIKDRRSRRVRTTFGQVEVSCRRYHRCTCRGGRPGIEWPLRQALPARATPECAYLLAKWGARMPYRRAATSNAHLLFHYARTWRSGGRISTAMAESGMNHLINARMGKHQPMRWSAEGAHLLLQVRCALLDDRLDRLFGEWYPGWGTSPPAVAGSRALFAPPGS